MLWLQVYIVLQQTYGAIFETGAEFPMYIPYDDNYRKISIKSLAYGIEAAANTLHQKQIHNHLESQSAYANIYYNWNKIGYQHGQDF